MVRDEITHHSRRARVHYSIRLYLAAKMEILVLETFARQRIQLWLQRLLKEEEVGT